MSATILRDQLEQYATLADQLSIRSLGGYFHVLTVDANPDPGPYRTLKNPFQDRLLKKLTPLIEQATGHAPYNPHLPRCAFVVMPKGHSKTSFIAQIINWALSYAKRTIKCYVGAGDKSQANILLERMQAEANQNYWLRPRLHFINYVVSGPKGSLEVLSSDAPTSSGVLYDLCVIDEVTFHKKRDLFDILFAGRNKRSTACFIVLSNAGIISTWQHELWEQAKEDPAWLSFEVPAYSASWLNHEAIEEDRKILPLSLFRRLHENIWVHPADTGDYLSKEQVQPCVDDLHKEAYKGQPPDEYVLGLDLGVTNDPAVAAIVHRDEDEEIYLDKMQVWQGSPTERVPLALVREWVTTQLRLFPVVKVVLDPWQSEEMAQSWAAEFGIEVVRYSFQGQGHTRLAENLRALVTQKRLHLYPGAGHNPADQYAPYLIDELCQLIIEFSKDGRSYRFNHLAKHHDDRSCALALACMGAVTLPVPLIVRSTDFIKIARDRLPPTPYGTPSSSAPPLPIPQPVPEETTQEQEPENEEENMADPKYPDLKFSHSLGQWQPRPPGYHWPMPTFKTQEEAQWAKMLFYKLINSEPPRYDREIPELKPGQKEAIDKTIRVFMRENHIPIHNPGLPPVLDLELEEVAPRGSEKKTKEPAAVGKG